MPRPTGVTVIAVIMFLGVAYMLVLALGVTGGWVDPKSITPGMDEFPIDDNLLAKIALFTFLFSAAVSLTLGLGLWHAKAWARTITIVLSSIGIAMNGWAALGAAMVANDLELVTGLAGLGYNIWVVWYLVQPRVKQAFLPAPPASEPPSPPGGTPPPPPPPDPPARP